MIRGWGLPASITNCIYSASLETCEVLALYLAPCPSDENRAGLYNYYYFIFLLFENFRVVYSDEIFAYCPYSYLQEVK